MKLCASVFPRQAIARRRSRHEAQEGRCRYRKLESPMLTVPGNDDSQTRRVSNPIWLANTHVFLAPARRHVGGAKLLSGDRSGSSRGSVVRCGALSDSACVLLRRLGRAGEEYCDKPGAAMESMWCFKEVWGATTPCLDGERADRIVGYNVPELPRQRLKLCPSFAWLVRTLLSILSLYGITYQAALGSDITQVDLIFPRNGSTYRPVYPFPVVVAVTNAHLVWPYHFTVSWQFRDKEGVVQSDFTGPDSDRYNVDDQVSADRPLLLTWGTSDFINTTQTEFSLLLSTAIFQTCPINGTIANGVQSVGYNHAVFFRLSDDGELPDMEAAGPMSDPFGAFKMRGVGEDETRHNLPCPLVAKGPGNKGPVDPLPSSSTAVSPTRWKPSWPNATGLLGRCPRRSQDSGGTMHVPAGIMLSRGIFTTLAIALGYMWL
ncbi:hypothetical protein B0T11DRAFT_319608 [Plectosphaerella cucumerina]|uniref:DUF7136 domain-containing protein n=1 Tax=Plectosphaerella cucumerina TaxID=40658 RepID=A0A8K0X1T1_9PEZI|nr:hypothetical protein B0T11DRAFT_319608 [Plectosphaerella cucumerina]